MTAETVAEEMAETRRLVGMDLVEINPGAASFPAAERRAEMSRGWGELRWEE